MRNAAYGFDSKSRPEESPDGIVDCAKPLCDCLHQAVLIHTPFDQDPRDPRHLIPPTDAVAASLLPKSLDGPSSACQLHPTKTTTVN